MKITDELLLAYIDGELSREERARVEAAIAEDPELAERLRRHRAVEARIHEAFSGVAEEEAPDHLVQMVRPAAAVVSLEAARASRRPEPKPAKPAKPAFKATKLDPRWAGIAAALIAGLALGYLAPRTDSGLINGQMEAVGPLAAVLDNRLASTQAANAPIRIGLTFQDGSKRWCRTFSGPTLAGVACRQGDGWRVRMAETGATAAGGDYRTASSPASPAVMATVEGMIAGEPVDAAAEKKAQVSGWR